MASKFKVGDVVRWTGAPERWTHGLITITEIAPLKSCWPIRGKGENGMSAVFGFDEVELVSFPFKVGDRVYIYRESPKEPWVNKDVVGKTGVVVGLFPESVGVSIDGYTDGYSLGGLLEDSSGWRCGKDELKLLLPGAISIPQHFDYWAASELGTPKSEAHLLPADSAERKKIPIGTGVLDYFPSALAEIARVSHHGNEQHNAGQPLHWARGKSADHGDTLIRHFLERGTLDVDGMRHSAKMAWRALAILQLELEAEGAPIARGAK